MSVPGFNLRRLGWLAIAGLLAVAVVACGDDSDDAPEPTAAPTSAPEPTEAPPEPTEAPPEPTEAAPEPTEAAPEPAMSLADLQISPETTGEELLSRISEDETACLSSAMGAANFGVFPIAPLMFAASQEGMYSVLADCLEQDNLVALGVGLMSAKAGGWQQGSVECVNGVASEHPELIYLAFGLADRLPQIDHPGGVHAELLNLYRCLNTVEQVIFNIVMRSEPVVPFTGQNLLSALPDAEVECMRSNLSEEEFDMVANAPTLFADTETGLPPQALACFSPDTIARIPIEIIIASLGVSSEASRSCMLQFFGENEQYVLLVTQVGTMAESLTPQDFAQIAEGALLLFECLNDEELIFFQENYLPTLVP